MEAIRAVAVFLRNVVVCPFFGYKIHVKPRNHFMVSHRVQFLGFLCGRARLQVRRTTSYNLGVVAPLRLADKSCKLLARSSRLGFDDTICTCSSLHLVILCAHSLVLVCSTRRYMFYMTTILCPIPLPLSITSEVRLI